MSGTMDCLYFFVLFRGTEHGQIRLQKMAGDLIQEHLYIIPSITLPSIAHRIVERASAANLCFAMSQISCVLDLLTRLLLLLTDCMSSFAHMYLAGHWGLGVVLPRARPQRAGLAWLVVEQPVEGHQGPLRPVPGRQAQGLPGVLVMCVLCIAGHAS